MTDAERRLLLLVSEAVRHLEVEGRVTQDMMRRLAAAEADLRALLPEVADGR